MRLWFLPGVLTVFALLSVLTLQSIAPTLAPRQLAFFFISAVIFIVASRVPFENIKRLSPLGYGITIFLLILTLIISLETRNTSRWIEVGGLFKLQPSQLAVPFTAIMLARFAAENSLKLWKNLLKALTIVAIPGVLILIEPDLGTTLVYLASLAVVFFFSDIRWQQVLALGAAGLIMVVIAWMFLLQPYQKERITSFMDDSQTESTLLSSKYNARQALIAVGSGQLVGRGLGQGVQSHLRFLPERQTDFIFASLAEEFGFIGASLLIGLYGLIFSFIIYTGYHAAKPEESWFCYTTAAMILLQAGVNMGMNMGLLPITGVTLPLLSYGGSSILTIAGTLGIVQSITQNRKKGIKLSIR